MDDAPEIRFIECQFQRISINSGDVVVITCPQRLTKDVFARIHAQAEKIFTGNKILILSDGVKIGAMGAE